MSDTIGVRILYVCCEGEFASRLLCLASGLALARASELEVCVVWPQTIECGASFSDIFSNDEFVVVTSLEASDTSIRDVRLTDGFGSFEDLLSLLNGDARSVRYSIDEIPSYFEYARLIQELSRLGFKDFLKRAALDFQSVFPLAGEYFGLFITPHEINDADPAEAGSALYLVRQARDKAFFMCSLDAHAESVFAEEPNVVLRKKEVRTAQSSIVDLLILAQSLIIKTSEHPMLLAAILLKGTGLSLSEPAQDAPPYVRSPKKVVDTYCQWHLGDNLILLHFLRKMSERYLDVEFRHALNPEYLRQCNEVVQDLSAIRLSSLPDTRFSSQPIDGWKGADGFFFEHPRRYDYGTVFVDFFAKMARKMGLESPIKNPEMLLFDYPALKRRVLSKQYDFLVVNSVPLSGQFKQYSEERFLDVLHRIQGSGFSLITTKKVEGFDCTLDHKLTVTGIGNVSLYTHFFFGVVTGSMWTSMNVFNNFRHEKKVLLDNETNVDFGENVLMARDMEDAIQALDLVLSTHRPMRLSIE